MKFTFLGSGSAFELGKDNYNSNILIEGGRSTLLFDAGVTIGDALDDAGWEPSGIDYIFISHLHADHVGGLEYIGYKRYFNEFPFGNDSPILIGYHEFLDELWNNSLKGGMQYLKGTYGDLETFFDTFVMNKVKTEQRIPFFGTMMPFKTSHVNDDVYKTVPSYGAMFVDEENGH